MQVYLDSAATTKPLGNVVNAMLPYLQECYGNPGSKYSLGREAKAAIDKSREQVAALINAEPEQIIFTSGGSEANNLAIKNAKGRSNIICSNVEHKSVLKYSSIYHEVLGSPVLKVNEQCVLTEEEVKTKLSGVAVPHKTLVSTMYVNNETGAVNDIEMIAGYCKKFGMKLHVDCVQALSCLQVDVKKLGCDYASFSAHKIHGPKGVGCLYIRDPKSLGFSLPSLPKVETHLIDGGSAQEFGMRAGTENVPGIVGFGEAALTLSENVGFLDYTKDLSEYFCDELSKRLSPSRYRINCQEYNNGKTLSITFFGVDSETLLMYLDTNEVYISAGSACTSHETVPSYVLKAVGMTDEEAYCTVRISFDWFLTKKKINYALDKIVEGVLMLNPEK